MSSINIKPLYDRVVVQRIEERKTAGGIVIPDTSTEKSQRGIVKAVGELKDLDKKMQVKVGDVVLFGKYSGTEVRISGEDYLIMKEEDIMAIILN